MSANGGPLCKNAKVYPLNCSLEYLNASNKTPPTDVASVMLDRRKKEGFLNCPNFKLSFSFPPFLPV